MPALPEEIEGEKKVEKVIRAFEMPLHHADAATWALLRECWRQARALANWCQVEMVRQDVLVDGQGERLKKPPEFDLYARAFGREVEKRGKKDASKTLSARKAGFPGRDSFAGAMLSAASIINDVQSEYRSDRWSVHQGLRCWRSYRSYPWPVHGQMVKAAWLDGNGRPCLRLTLPGGQVELRMRGGPEFSRQMAHFRRLVGKATEEFPFTGPFKEVVLREKKCRGGDVMVKMVCELPVCERTGDRTLVVITDPDAFWIAELDGQPAWVTNRDHISRVVARHQEHLRELQRLGQDAKAERRLGSNRSWQQLTRLEVICEKDRNRLASFTHEVSCHLAEYARRQGVAEVFYLDRDRGFIPKFPWHELHSKLKQKLEERGITLYSESKGESGGQDSNQPLQGGPAASPTVVDIKVTEGDDRWLRVTRLREMAARKLLAAVSRNGSHRSVSARLGT